MPDVNDLCDYWVDNPPPHLELQSLLGLRKAKRKSSTNQRNNPRLTETEQMVLNIAAEPSSEIPEYAKQWLKENSVHV